MKENENIKELGDIRREYAISLAKLMLIPFYPNLAKAREDFFFLFFVFCFLWFVFFL